MTIMIAMPLLVPLAEVLVKLPALVVMEKVMLLHLTAFGKVVQVVVVAAMILKTIPYVEAVKSLVLLVAEPDPLIPIPIPRPAASTIPAEDGSILTLAPAAIRTPPALAIHLTTTSVMEVIGAVANTTPT